MDNSYFNQPIDNSKPEEIKMPNDITGIEPIDNHDDGPEPKTAELYLEREPNYDNHDDPQVPPPSMGVVYENFDETMNELEKEKEKAKEEDGLNIPPYQYQDTAALKEYLEGLKAELQNGLEQEQEEKEVVSMHM